MRNESNRSELGAKLSVKKIGLTIASSVLLASVTLPLAALAENGGGYGGAFRDFRAANPDLSNKELRQSFRQEWQSNKIDRIQSFSQPVVSDLQSGALNLGISPVNNLNQNLTKDELREQRLLQKQQLRDLKTSVNSTIQNTGTHNITVANGFSLDLASVTENITLGGKLFKEVGSITIEVGGEKKTLTAGTKVTAAEYVAAKQALSGSQQVTLDADGKAIGGIVDLSAMTSGNKNLKINDLHVSEGVTAYGDFGKGGDVQIKGDLANSGEILALSSNKNVNVATIKADNITNNANSTITSQLSGQAQALGGEVGDLSLNLIADKSLNNYGTISSAGDLTLSAGKAINNTGVLSAQNNVNVLASDVKNSGSISSIGADVNLTGVENRDLNVVNSGGTINALHAINVRNDVYDGAFNSSIKGGDLFSSEVNINSGHGTADLAVGELTGTINSKGLAVHVSADTDILNLGEQCLSGDPIFFNTGGSVNLTNPNITAGEAITILATGDITTSSSTLNIFAAGGGRGYDINIIAGVDVVSDVDTGNISFTGASATGGSIDFSTASAVNINSSASSFGNDAGDITLAAYSVGGVNGQVLLPAVASSLLAKGISSGRNGNITILAGSSSSTGIQVGFIDNTGGSIAEPAVGNILIANQQPLVSDGAAMIFNSAGTQISNNSLVGNTGFATTGNIATGNILYGEKLTVRSNSQMTLGSITAATADGSGGRIELYSNSATAFTIGGGGANSTGNINANATAVGGQGGLVSITNAGTGGITVATAISQTASGNAGSLELFSDFGTLDVSSYNGSIALDGVSANGVGGAVRLNYSSLVTGANGLLVSVNGGTTGNAGVVLVSKTSSSGNLIVGNDSGEIGFSAVGGTGALDGLVLLFSNSSVTVDSASTLLAGTLQFNVNGANSITFDKNILTSDGIQNLSMSASSINQNGNIDISGALQYTALNFTSAASLAAGNITIQNLAGNLTINGLTGLTLLGRDPVAGSAGSPTNPAAINFIAPGTITLQGLIDVDGGDLAISNSFGTTVSAAGSLLTSVNNVVLNTGSWVQNEMTPQIVANDLLLTLVNGGTIINTVGDVNLYGNITITGQDLAIIARDAINLGNTVINTNGSDLTLLAGFNFDPATVGQVSNSATTYSLLSGSGTGSINGLTSTLNTSSVSGDAGNIRIFADGGNINLGTVSATSGNGTGGNVEIFGTNNVSISGPISTTGTTSDGSVSMGSGVINFSAFTVLDGTTSGSISGSSDFTSTGSISVGAINANRASLNISTGDVGAVGLSGAVSARDITINGGALSNSQGQLVATRNLNGDGGNITLNVNSFVGGPQLFSVSGVGNGSGGNLSIFITTFAPIVFGSGAGSNLYVDVSGGATGDAGNLSAFINSDATFNSGGVTATGVNGGSIFLQSPGGLTFNAGSIDATPTNGSGAEFQFQADFNANIVLNDATFLSAANATGADGDGGKISLDANRIIANTSVSSPLVLSANGIGTGDGGSILYRNFDTTAVYVGTPPSSVKGAANFLSTSAISGAAGGDGGSIAVSTGGNLIVQASALQAGPQAGIAEGASYTLESGLTAAKGGTLIVNGDLNTGGIGGGNDGNITINTNSSTAFSIDSAKAPKNGVFGTLDAGDGEIEITNSLGGILVSTSNAVTAQRVSLTAGGKGTLITASGAVLNSDVLSLTSASGAIGGKTGFMTNASAISVETFGAATVALVGPTLATLNASTVWKDFKVTAANGLDVGNVQTVAGDISLIANGGNLNIFNGATVTANNGALTLQNTNLSGDIVVGDGATVQTMQKGGQTTIAIGPVPKKGTNPTPPAVAPSGMTLDPQGKKGQIFLGTGTITVNGTTLVRAINKPVVFNNAGTGQIILNNGSVVIADPPSPVATNTAAFALTSVSNTNAPGVFSFSTENVISTPDLSVASLNASSQAQLANNANLYTAESLNTKSLTLTNSEEDDSYVVGYCNAAGVVNAAFCSDHAEGSLSVGNVQKLAHARNMTMTDGNTLFAPSTDTVVETPNGRVRIAAQSVVLVSNSSHGLAVYDLEDQHKGSVSVESDGHIVTLSPGRHVMITPHHTAEFAQINAIETVAHKNVVSAIKNGTRAHISEFYIPSALDTVAPLKALVKSNHPQAKKIAARMIKTTAILVQLGGGGEFQHYFKPRMTAMSK